MILAGFDHLQKVRLGQYGSLVYLIKNLQIPVEKVNKHRFYLLHRNLQVFGRQQSKPADFCGKGIHNMELTK